MRNYLFGKEINQLKDLLIKKIEDLFHQGYVIDYNWMMTHFENIAFVDGECQYLSENIPYLCKGECGISLSFWECEREESPNCLCPYVPEYINPKFFQYRKGDDEHFENPLENVCIEHLNVLLFYMVNPDEN